MEPSADRSELQSKGAPYPTSWIDRLIHWIDRLPGPTWLANLLALLGTALLINAVFWIDGSLPAGSFDPINTSFAIFVIYWPLLYRHLTRVGGRALRDFRPLLEVDDLKIAKIDYELATLPRRLGWLATILGYALSVITILGDPAPYGNLVPRTALPYIGDIAITGFMASTFFGLVIRSIRQLRMVARLHTQATNINLLELGPVHSFSGLTARTGAGIILVLIFSYIADPFAESSTLDVLLYVATALLAIAVFILPVVGIQDRIEEEKDRLLKETSAAIQMASDRLHHKVRMDDYEGIAGTDAALAALIRERDLLQRISTWPWDPRTIRGFASALVLPIFLWLVTRLLEGVL
jgi:hypothetical protein